MTFKLEQDLITPSLELKIAELKRLPQRTFQKFVSVTPKRTGNARSSTRLVNEVIRADYAYAEPLDKGKSKQAPDGMTKPTVEWLRRQANNIIKRK